MSLATSADRRNRAGVAVKWVPTVLAAGTVAFLGVQHGPPSLWVGAGGAVSLLAARHWLWTPYAFAVGQVALVATLGTRSPGATVWLAEAALLATLVAPELDSRRGRSSAVATAVATVVLVAVAWGAQVTWERTWATALALAATGALMAYGLHRFEQVALGMVEHE